MIDPGSASTLGAWQPTAALQASRRKASNFLLVGAGDTANGHPMAVMGPQLGYFYPEIVMQADLHGAGHRRPGDRRADLAVRVHRPRTRLRLEPHERRQREHAAVPREALQPRRTAPPTRESTYYDIQRRMHRR